MTKDEKTIRNILVFWTVLLILVLALLFRLVQQNNPRGMYKSKPKPKHIVVKKTYLYDTCDACCIYRYFGWKNNHIGTK